MTVPARLPDATSLEAVLAGLDPATADADLVHALAAAFPGLDFSLAQVDDEYWRDTRTVIRPDGTRVRLPDPDAAVLLRWAERTYGF
jgi:hypothetical protein